MQGESSQGRSIIFAVTALIIVIAITGVYVLTVAIVEDAPERTAEPNEDSRPGPTNTLRFSTPVRTLVPGLQPFSPGSGSTAAVAPTTGSGVEGCQVRTDWATYTVQPGDTFGSIAANYGLSIAELNAGNCLANPDNISVGQVLRVPN